MRANEWMDTFGDMGIQQGAQLTKLPLAILDPWVDEDGNPQRFHRYTEKKMLDFMDNIRENGIIEPIRARPLPSGRFQILAGHNRVEAARRIGFTTVPAIVEEVDDNQAGIMLVDSNVKRREKLSPSELAWAISERIKRMNRRGQRNDLTLSQIATKLDTAAEVGKLYDISRDKVFRYLRLNKLIPSLLDKVDAGTMGMTVGADLSYLSPEAQAMLVRLMEQHGIKKLKGSQSAELKAAAPEPSEETFLRVLGIFGKAENTVPSLTIKPDFSGYAPSLVKRLKKSPDYLEGLQIAIRQFTDKYIENYNTKEETT